MLHEIDVPLVLTNQQNFGRQPMNTRDRFFDPHGICFEEEPVFVKIQKMKGPIATDANSLVIQLHGCTHVRAEVQSLVGLVPVHFGVEQDGLI
jgi:hypothetical protein